MSLPVLGVVEECRSKANLLDSSVSRDGVCSNSALKERNYMGLSDCSSVDSSTISSTSEENDDTLTLKATELRLGFLRSESPERDPEFCLLSSPKLDEKPLFPLHPSKDNNNDKFLLKTAASGNKRGFSDAMDSFSKGNFHANPEAMLSSRVSPSLGVKTGLRDTLMTQPAKMKEPISQNGVQERPLSANRNTPNHASGVDSNNSAPANKAQVVGWPPIRSFRKNTLAASSKNTEEVDGKAGPGALFVKVSMDGAPYLRKVDLRTYSTYLELSSALEKMFSCFTIGQFGSHGALGKEAVSEIKLKDLLHGSEYVVTYEDKDGDWMLVGDVPWEMFIDTCKRLKIMKSSDAIGLAPRVMEKCGNKK